VYGRAYTRLQHEPQAKPSIVLPDDCEPNIPGVSYDWITKYELTYNELQANHVLWSERRQLLVFPYFGESTKQLLGWQGRYFGNDKHHPKWFTKGYIRDFIKVVNLQKARESGIIYVEDIVSAIKLGRITGACPVFGSFIPKTHSIRLNKMGIDKFTVWLDPDKYKDALKFSKQITELGFSSRVIRSDLDPKEHSMNEIKELLNDP
jgi:hypothetical protein